MFKVILIPTSFCGISFDHSIAYEFENGRYIKDEAASTYSNIWIETTLPAVPPVDSGIVLDGIDENEMREQLKNVYEKCLGFRNFIKKYQEEVIAADGSITFEETLDILCEKRGLEESLYGPCWYVDRVDFRANDEYLYVYIYDEQ